MSVLVGDDKRVIEMIKDTYLKESIIMDNEEARKK
jgi:hypothetical protein